MRELLQEIFATIRRNKLRTFLTGFSVAWGIFMLIILLGAGNGLKNGMMSNFEGMAMNSVTIGGGRTDKAYKGYPRFRRIRFEKGDATAIKDDHPAQVGEITERFNAGGSTASANGQFLPVRLSGVDANYTAVGYIRLEKGRLINAADIAARRKVVIVEQYTAEALFKDEDPVGKTLRINNVNYTIVGQYKGGSRSNTPTLFAPLTTLQDLYASAKPVSEIRFLTEGLNTVPANESFNTEVRHTLAGLRTFDPEDQSAVWINNPMREYLQVMSIFGGLNLFIWIIGLGTLLAGIVGVSNIMLVTVRERTFEFGIRKSMGASPASLVRLMLIESVMVTAFFGYIGMILGIGVMEGLNLMLESQAPAGGDGPVIFKDPTLQLGFVLSATVVLVAAGMVAGYVPARRAAQLKTIDAMRFNK